MIGAWFIAPQNTDVATIIFLHGMGANRSELLREAAICVKQGYGALLIDLRNHGRSGAAMTTFGYGCISQTVSTDVRNAVDKW